MTGQRTKLEIALSDVIDFLLVHRWQWHKLPLFLALVVILIAIVLVFVGLPMLLMVRVFGLTQEVATVILTVTLLGFVYGALWWESIKERQRRERRN